MHVSAGGGVGVTLGLCRLSVFPTFMCIPAAGS